MPHFFTPTKRPQPPILGASEIHVPLELGARGPLCQGLYFHADP